MSRSTHRKVDKLFNYQPDQPQGATQLELKDITTAKITTNLTSLINVDDKSKSSSFSLPRPSGTFRSVQRPNRRLNSDATNSSNSSKTQPENKPVAMTYADIMAKKRAEQQKQVEEKSAPPPPPPAATQSASPIPQQPAVDGNQSDNNQDYQNTSDDAESIPISYQVKKTYLSNLNRIINQA